MGLTLYFTNIYLGACAAEGTTLDNFFLIGMTSKYDGSRWENGQQVGTADRSFKFYYATHHHYRLDNCVWTDYSTYDEEVLLPDAFASLTWGKKTIFNFHHYFIHEWFPLLILKILFLHRK